MMLDVDPFAPVDGAVSALLGPTPDQIREMLQNAPDSQQETQQPVQPKQYICMIEDCQKVFPD